MSFRSRGRGRPFRETGSFRGREKLNISSSRPDNDDYKPSHRSRTPPYESEHKIRPPSSHERDYRSRDYKDHYSGSRRYDDLRSDRRRYSRSRSRSPGEFRCRNWRRSRSRNRSRSRHRSFSPHHRSPRRSPSRSPRSSRHTSSSFRYHSNQRSPDRYRSGNERLEVHRTLPPGFKELEDPETSELLEKSLGPGRITSPPPESLRITVGNDLFKERCGSKSIHDRLGSPPETSSSAQFPGRRDKYVDTIGFNEKLGLSGIVRSEQDLQSTDNIDLLFSEKKIERNVLLQDSDHFSREPGSCFSERLDGAEKIKSKLNINLEQISNDSFSTFNLEMDSPPWVNSPSSSIDQFKQSSKSSKKKMQQLKKEVSDTKPLFCGIPGLSDDLPTKSYTSDILIPGLGDVEGIDDEERFLYGDDADNTSTLKSQQKTHTVEASIRKKVRKFTRSSSTSSSRSSSRSSSKSSSSGFRHSRNRSSISRSYSRSPSRKRTREDHTEKRGRKDSSRYINPSYYSKYDADSFHNSRDNSFPSFSDLVVGSGLSSKEELRKEKTLHKSESNIDDSEKIKEADFLKTFSEPIKGGSRKLEDILKSIGFNFDMLRKPKDAPIQEKSPSFTITDKTLEVVDKYGKRNDSDKSLHDDSRVPSNVASLIQAARHKSESPWQQQSFGVSSQDTLTSNVTSQASAEYCQPNYSIPHQPTQHLQQQQQQQFPPIAPPNYPPYPPYQGHFTQNYPHPMYPGPFPHMPPFPNTNDNYDPNVVSTANRSNLRVIPLQSDAQKANSVKSTKTNLSTVEKHLPGTPKMPSSNLTNLKVISSTFVETKKKLANEKPSSVGKNLSTEMEKKPLTPKEKQELVSKHEGSLKRLELLEKELDRLRKQQGELMRKKQKQKDGHKDPLLMENNKLQEEISRQINSIRRSLEDAGTTINTTHESSVFREEKSNSASICQSLESEHSSQQAQAMKYNTDASEQELEYEYFDPGNHWCKQCNEMLPNIYSMFEHLHSKRHIQNLDPYDRPWMPECLKNPQQKASERTMVAPLKGVQFLIPCSAFYCTVCSEFMGDATCAEDHLKKVPHNRNYLRYVLENPFYERRWNLDKAAGMAVRSDEKRKQIIEDAQKKIKENKHLKRSKEVEEMDSVSEVKENQSDKDNKLVSRSKSIEKEKSESPVNPVSDDDMYKSSGFGKFTWRKDEKDFIGPENLESNFDNSKDSESDEQNSKIVTKPGSKIAIRLSGKTLIPPSVQFKSVNRKKVEIGKMPQLAFPLRKIKQEKNHSEKPLPLGKFISVEKPSAAGKAVPLPIAQDKSSPASSSSPIFLPTQEDIANAFGGKFEREDSEGQAHENSPEVNSRVKKLKTDSSKKSVDVTAVSLPRMSFDVMAIPLPPADVVKAKESNLKVTGFDETSKIKKLKILNEDSAIVKDSLSISGSSEIEQICANSNVITAVDKHERDVKKHEAVEQEDLSNKNLVAATDKDKNTAKNDGKDLIKIKLKEDVPNSKTQPQLEKQIELSESEKADREDLKMLGIDINDTVVIDVRPPPVLSESSQFNRPANSVATASVSAKDMYEIYFNKNSTSNLQPSTEIEVTLEYVAVHEKANEVAEACTKKAEDSVQKFSEMVEDRDSKKTLHLNSSSSEILNSSEKHPIIEETQSHIEKMDVDNHDDSVCSSEAPSDFDRIITTNDNDKIVSIEDSEILKELPSDGLSSSKEEMEVYEVERNTNVIESIIDNIIQTCEVKVSSGETAQTISSSVSDAEHSQPSSEVEYISELNQNIKCFSIDNSGSKHSATNENEINTEESDKKESDSIHHLNEAESIKDSEKKNLEDLELVQSSSSSLNRKICSNSDKNSSPDINSFAEDLNLEEDADFINTSCHKFPLESATFEKNDVALKNEPASTSVNTEINEVQQEIERCDSEKNMENQTVNVNPEQECLVISDSVDKDFKNSNENISKEKIFHPDDENSDEKSPTQKIERVLVQDQGSETKDLPLINISSQIYEDDNSKKLPFIEDEDSNNRFEKDQLKNISPEEGKVSTDVIQQSIDSESNLKSDNVSFEPTETSDLCQDKTSSSVISEGENNTQLSVSESGKHNGRMKSPLNEDLLKEDNQPPVVIQLSNESIIDKGNTLCDDDLSFESVKLQSQNMNDCTKENNDIVSILDNITVCHNVVLDCQSTDENASDNICSEIIESDLVSSEKANCAPDQNLKSIESYSVAAVQKDSESSGKILEKCNDSVTNEDIDIPSLSDNRENQTISSEILVETVLGQTFNETFDSKKTDE